MSNSCLWVHLTDGGGSTSSPTHAHMTTSNKIKSWSTTWAHTPYLWASLTWWCYDLFSGLQVWMYERWNMNNNELTWGVFLSYWATPSSNRQSLQEVLSFMIYISGLLSVLAATSRQCTSKDSQETAAIRIRTGTLWRRWILMMNPQHVKPVWFLKPENRSSMYQCLISM